MTPKQLREWLFQNSQTDQWWGAFDDVTEESAVTVDDIEERLKSGLYKKAQVLHVSQTELSNPPWIEVELPAAPLPPIIITEQKVTPPPIVSRPPIVTPPPIVVEYPPQYSNQPQQSDFSLLRVFGLLLLVAGMGVVGFFLFAFDTTVSTGYGSVNNLGLMSTRQNGIIVGGILSVVGVLLGLIRRN